MLFLDQASRELASGLASVSRRDRALIWKHKVLGTSLDDLATEFSASERYMSAWLIRVSHSIASGTDGDAGVVTLQAEARDRPMADIRAMSKLALEAMPRLQAESEAGDVLARGACLMIFILQEALATRM